MIKVGFELEVILTCSGYPKLVTEAEKRNFYLEADEEAPYFLRKIVADDLSEYVGEKVSAPKTDSPNLTKNWSVKAEYDVEHAAYTDAATAVEIIIPPKPIEEGIQALSKVIDFCLDTDSFTDPNCGLHMTFDIPKQLRAPMVGIALELNEETILKTFNRELHGLAVPQKDKILVEVVTALNDGNEYALDNDFLEHSLGKGKHFAINVEKLNRYGVVEFRHCGGDEVLYLLPELTHVIGKIHQIISDAEQMKSTPKYGDIIKKDVMEIMKILPSLTYGEERARFVGRKEFPVSINGKCFGRINQLSAVEFTFYFNDNIRPTTALKVDSFSKAKALAAMSYLNLVKRLQ